MKKNNIVSKLRDYVINFLSPTSRERALISNVYNSFQDLFSKRCIQIGSFPRFTAIRPIHDLDILYIIGDWDEENHNPHEILDSVKQKIETEFRNPTEFDIQVSLQTHSVTVLFLDGEIEVFSVDIVPGYIFGKNEFTLDMYKVPEIVNLHHGSARNEFYKTLAFEQKEMMWIASDPRGYTEVARIVNETNSDFRKSTKFLKAWKNSCKNKDVEFKLKSFHIEQIMTRYFQDNPTKDIFDGVFYFFFTIPDWIKYPQIYDRADHTKFIDDYVVYLSESQKRKIIEARDCLLKKLEEFTDADSIEFLIDSCYYTRSSGQEQFLFDFNIPVLIDEDIPFEIVGDVQERKGGFRPKELTVYGKIDIDRKINFGIKGKQPTADYFMWKVKNDKDCKEPRGDITKHQTKNVPETTRYPGIHYVECYAIKNNICIAKARQYVRLVFPGN